MPSLHRLLLPVWFVAVACAPAQAQTESELRDFFEGKSVIVKLDMPATQEGVDLFPDARRAIDFAQYSAADQKLIVEMLNLGASVKSSATTISTATTQASAATAAAVAQYNALEARANTEAAAIAKGIARDTALGVQRVDLFGTEGLKPAGFFVIDVPSFE